MNKYWVDKGQDEYMVITDSFDNIGGNSYEVIKGGFETFSLAQEHADTLNEG